MSFKTDVLLLRLLSVLAGMVAVFALSTVSAAAEFHSTNGKATGASKSGPVVLEGGGATLECSSAEGTGTILSGIGGKQQTEGPVLSLEIKTWNGCKAKSSEFKELKPKVKACILDMKQAVEENKATGSVVAECTVETTVLFLTCTIHLLPEKEKENVNWGLEVNTLEDSGNNLLIHAEDHGITTTTTGTCPGVGGTKEGKEKGAVSAEEMNASQPRIVVEGGVVTVNLGKLVAGEERSHEFKYKNEGPGVWAPVNRIISEKDEGIGKFTNTDSCYGFVIAAGNTCSVLVTLKAENTPGKYKEEYHEGVAPNLTITGSS